MHVVRSHRKSLGAFYTSEDVAEALVGWGLRVPRRAVLDPSCGDGRFLAPAISAGVGRVVGCDIDAGAIEQARTRLGASPCELLHRNFFDLEPGELQPFDLVVGNPPFIRYQHFRGETRKRALQTALRAGVRLTGLTSSWAPFLLHAMQFVAPGGDLAMVVPAEILQTQYGLPALRAMTWQFGQVSLLLPESNFFSEAQEACALLLAQGRGGKCEAVRLVSARDVCGFARALREGIQGGVMISSEPRARFAEALLTRAQRDAWVEAIGCEAVVELASLGTVTNGYVTGDNDFFHRTMCEAVRAGIPDGWMRLAARSSRSLQGLSLTSQDIAAHEAAGAPHHLIVPPREVSDAHALELMRAEGEHRGTPLRYKCRVREPWWLVPGLMQPDVLLGYMSGAHPRAALNEARALHTNSLHGLRLRAGVDGRAVVFAMHSSLALLSLEIEGRSYGGGILKLEPTEMRHARVAMGDAAALQGAMLDADALLRTGRYDDAVELVDEALLVGQLGWSRERVALLQAAWRRLRARRLGRARGDRMPSLHKAKRAPGASTVRRAG
jgi:adenine-specific DNA-methyltransferase